LPAYFEQLLSEQPAPRPFFAKNLRKSGEVFDVRIDWNYIRNQEGKVTGFVSVVSDITEHKRAKQELQQAYERLEQRVLERTAELTEAKERLQAEVEQRRTAEVQLDIFRRFAEAATQGFAMADVDGQITYVNPFLARLFGAQQSEDVIGKHVATYYPSDYLLRREREIMPALRRGEHWQGEQRMVFPDGLMHPTIHSVFPVHDEKGALLCTAAVITDITELKRAEEALRQSYEELRTIYECMVDGLLIADIETKGFVKANRAISEMLGYSPEELVSMSVRDVHPQEDLPAVLATFQSQLEGCSCRADNLLMLRRDGTVLSVDITANRMMYHDRLCLIGFFRDVTERKRAEDARRQAMDQLEAIYEGMIEGLLITDIETKRFVRVNASVCRMLGYSEVELLGAAIQDIHPAEEVPKDERLFQAAAEGRVSINLERPVLRKDGSIFYADITGRRILYDGRPCLLGLFRDVTERRLAEEKVKAEQRALRRMVLASDHERRLITYELHDGVAQQLMGAIMHFQSQEPPPGSTPKAMDAYRVGIEALRQASSEIRSVMSRLRTPVLDMYGLAEAIEDVVSQLRSRPGAPEIECRYDIQFKRLEPTLENSLFRIAQEAMTNACRHSKSDKVRVQLTQQGDWVALEVRDWGIGFDKGTLQGNRFGLEGIRQRTRLLGGKLSIKSKPGEGAVVRVKFPVLEATGQE
jgi:PAS domain S-box-containing protein